MTTDIVELKVTNLLLCEQSDVFNQSPVLCTSLLQTVSEKRHLLFDGALKPYASRSKFFTKGAELLLGHLLVLNVPDCN